MSLILYFLVSPERCHSSGDKAKSIKYFFNFLIDWVVIKARSSISLNFLLALETSPASVQTMNLDNLKSANIFSSKGFRVICSLVFPAVISKAKGIPSPSIKSPIWVIGLGLCSLEGPYCLKPLSCSISKK